MKKTGIGLMLFLGLFLGNVSVNAQESEMIEEYNAILLEADECEETSCEEIELPYDLEQSEKKYEDPEEKRPRITWEKNPKSLGNFDPDKLYFMEDVEGFFQVVEKETLKNGDDEVNLVAVAMDENENDYYTFHMSYPAEGQDWEEEFEKFVTSFEK